MKARGKGKHKMADRPADTKREKISKAQQLTMLEVLIASLILGTCLVLVNFLLKYISFNTKIITAKNQAITEYDQTIRNVGVCADTDKNGRLSDKELENCNPNTVSLDQVVNSLRYNVFETMAGNEDLELVARKRNENCYDENGERIDFSTLYNNEQDETKKEQYLQSLKVCSSLRVISDALPAQENTEALMASLNQLFLLAGIDPESLSPRDGSSASELAGISILPVTLRVDGSGALVLNALDTIERSIREFDIQSASVEWSSNGINLQAQANAFFLSRLMALETTMTVTPKTKVDTTKNSATSATSLRNAAMEGTK